MKKYVRRVLSVFLVLALCLGIGPLSKYILHPKAEETNPNHVWFGSYPIEGKDADPTPLKWKVIYDDGEYYTLFNDEVIFSGRYGGSFSAASWGDSEIRQFLNNEFYQKAFSANEQADMSSTTISFWSYTSGAGYSYDSSTDKVYILSTDEYMNPDYGFSESGAPSESRIPYYNEKSAYLNVTTHGNSVDELDRVNHKTWVWTRDVHANNYGAPMPTYVTTDGGIYSGGQTYSTWNLGLQPVIRVKKDSKYLYFTDPGSNIKTSTNSPQEDNWNKLKNHQFINEEVFDEFANVITDSSIIPGLDITHVINNSGKHIACKNMVPQGVCIAEGYTFISAYCEEQKHDSVLYVLKNGKYLETIILSKEDGSLNKCHVGGLAYLNGNIYIAGSSDHCVYKIQLSTLLDELGEQDARRVNITKAFDTKNNETASFITSYNGNIYVGTFYTDGSNNPSDNSTIRAYDPSKGEIEETNRKIELPTNKAQGISFVKKGNQTYLFVSSSFNRNNTSELLLIKWNGEEKLTENQIHKTIKIPNMSEDICITADSLWIAFESGASKYLTGEKIRPLDRVISINYNDLLKNPNNLIDTDGDAIPDTWEKSGADYNGDGIIDLHLEKMGCDPNKKDVFVEVDWMYQPHVDGAYLGVDYPRQLRQSRQPGSEAMKEVYESFKKHNINLHIDVGPSSIDYVTGKEWGDLSGGNSIPYADYLDLGSNHKNWIKLVNQNFDEARRRVFRHCFFINKFNLRGSSGIAASIPGQCFIVALRDYSMASNKAVAGTFMHELGHTLGLRHGGTDDDNYKPNHLSIMNYSYQMSGLLGTDELTYSNYSLPALDEKHINERNGIDPEGIINYKSSTEAAYKNDKNLGVKWQHYDSLYMSMVDIHGVSSNALTNIDFDQNKKIENDISEDVNGDRKKSELSKSINEWAALQFAGGAIGDYGADVSDDSFDIAPSEEIDESLEEELSFEEALEIGVAGNPEKCVINSITPTYLYDNIDNQYLYVTIDNMSSMKSHPTIIVDSELLSSTCAAAVDIDGSNDDISQYCFEIPIDKKLEKKSYTVTCTLKNADGEIETKSETIEVKTAETIRLAPGKSFKLTNESDELGLVSWRSENDSIAIFDNNSIIAKDLGETIVWCTCSDGSMFAYRIIVEDSKTSFINNLKYLLNGVVKGPKGWAYYKNGEVDTSYTGIAHNLFGWWRVKDGYVDFEANGIYQNQHGWWKTTKGKVTFIETGVFQNENGWWRVENSKVNFKANGIYQNKNGWWKTTNGKVTFDETGVFQNQFGWWYVKDSKVDFGFTGIASNQYGTWYINNGRVEFTKNGMVDFDGKTYQVTFGKAKLA